MNRLVHDAALACLALAVLLAPAAAQFDVNGPNAEFFIDGKSPGVVDPIDHDVETQVPGTLDLEVTSGMNPNQGLILLASLLDPTGGNVLPVPWGSIDIGMTDPVTGNLQNVVAFGDGIFFSVGPFDGFFVTDAGNPITGAPPTWRLAATAVAGLAGVHLAFQCIVEDPTMTFGIDNTEAGDANFVAGQTLVLNPTSATSSVQVPFLPGKVFNFHGVAYTDVFVNNKGFINFGGTTSAVNGGFDIDAQNWITVEPAISAWLSDWENTTAPDGILYQEVGSTARISWGDPLVMPNGLGHYLNGGTQADTNRFAITLQLNDPAQPNPLEGDFTIDIAQTDPSTSLQNGDGFIGQTPGGAQLSGSKGEVSLHDEVQVGAAGGLQVEEHDATGGNASVLGADGTGAIPRAYNNFHSWDSTSITFVPNPPFTTTGDQGYTSQASSISPDDVTGTVPLALPVSGGPVTVVGKFWNFNDAAGNGGSVVFDPGGANIPGFIVGIHDGSGTVQPSLANNPATSPYRNAEALDIMVPPFPNTGTYMMQVTFNSGSVFTLPVNVVSSGVVVTQYSLGNGGTTPSHNLTNTIDFYGVTYTNLYIQSHGYVTLGNVTANEFQEDMNWFFNGFVAGGQNGGQPGVAAIWSDLNKNNTAAIFEVAEDTTTNETSINFRNQTHWDTGGSAGDVSVVFGTNGPGSVRFDLTSFIPDAGSGHDVIIGVTDGDDTTGPNTDLTNGSGTGFAGVQGTYSSAAAPDSIGERYTAGQSPGSLIFNLVDMGNGTTIPYGTWVIF